MEIIILIINILMSIYTIIFCIKSFFYIKQFNNKRNVLTSVSLQYDIVIAIPVLMEQKNIEDTIKYFIEITKGKYPIILITSQKEMVMANHKLKTTQEIIKENIIGKYKNVYMINYPKINGYMADQLNYMLENLSNILNKKIDLKKTYLALYNADSMPSKNTFAEVENEIKKGYEVIQQYSYCLKNYSKLSIIMKGFAIYQSNFELKTGLLNVFFDSKILYTHVVGHGLFVRLDILKKMENFNTKFWCEDIYLGLQLKFNKIKIHPLYSLENIETSDKLSILIKQNSVWFKTTRQFMKICIDILKRKEYTSKTNGLVGAFNEFRCSVNWLFFPIVLFLEIIVSIIIKKYYLILIIIMVYIYYIVLNCFFTVRIINKLENKKYTIDIFMLLGYFFACIISNFGPIYSFLNTSKEKYKTERK